MSEATGVSQSSNRTELTMAKAELSQEQVEELRQAFDMFDRDKGGSISTRELGYTMRAMGMNPTEAEILDLLCEVRLAWLVFRTVWSDLLLQFDSDNNGTIEFSHIPFGTTLTVKATSPPGLRRMASSQSETAPP